MQYIRSIEVLESRIAPAVVTATFAGGKLTIVGDGGDNAVTLIPGTNFLTVGTNNAANDLILNGTNLGPMGSAELTGVVNELAVDLGTGNDSIDVLFASLSKNVSIKGGFGNDTIKVFNTTIAGALTIDAGTDNDIVMLEGVVDAGKLAIDLGAGANQLKITATDLDVVGTASVKAGAGVDTITTGANGHLHIGGDFSIALGDGDNAIGLGADQVNQPAFLDIGGKFSIVQGAHTGVSLTTIITPNFSVGRDFSFTATGTGENQVSLGNAYVGGKTALKGSSGTDGFLFRGSYTSLVGGLQVDAKEGLNLLQFSATSGFMLGSLAYKGGAGNDSVVFDVGTLKSITGVTDIKLGEGNNDFTSNNGAVVLGAGLSIAGGKGIETITITGDAFSVASKGVKLLVGDGANVIDIDAADSLSVSGGIVYAAGAGGSGLTLNSAMLHVQGGISASIGDGANTLSVGGTNVFLSGGLKFTAKGSGLDNVNVTGARLTVTNPITVTGDAGVVEVLLGSVVSSFGAINVTNKAGGSSTTIGGAGDVFGAINIKGGTGLNNLNISPAGPALVVLHQALNFTSMAATGTETVTIQNASALGAVTIKLGAADTTITIDDVDFRRALTIDAGAGADTLDFERENTTHGGSTIISAALKVLMGSGDDTVRFGVPAGGPGVISFLVPVALTLLDGGDGTDTVLNNASLNIFGGIFTPKEINF